VRARWSVLQAGRGGSEDREDASQLPRVVVGGSHTLGEKCVVHSSASHGMPLAASGCTHSSCRESESIARGPVLAACAALSCAAVGAPSPSAAATCSCAASSWWSSCSMVYPVCPMPCSTAAGASSRLPRARGGVAVTSRSEGGENGDLPIALTAATRTTKDIAGGRFPTKRRTAVPAATALSWSAAPVRPASRAAICAAAWASSPVVQSAPKTKPGAADRPRSSRANSAALALPTGPAALICTT
jgi:hypothetical protein